MTSFVLERVSNPVSEPISLAEAIEQVKEFNSIPQSTRDDLTDLIQTSREWAEHFSGRCCVDQQWRITIDRRIGNAPGKQTAPAPSPENGYGWNSGEFNESVTGWMLRKSPVIAITSFVSIASDGTETAIAASEYRLAEPNGKWPRIVSTSGGLWTGDQFAITYRAGYAVGVGSPDPTPDLAFIPKRFKQAIKLYLQAHYDLDDKMTPMLITAAENLLIPERTQMQVV